MPSLFVVAGPTIIILISNKHKMQSNKNPLELVMRMKRVLLVVSTGTVVSAARVQLARDGVDDALHIYKSLVGTGQPWGD